MADIWGTVNYAQADPFSCPAAPGPITQAQSAQPKSTMLYPVSSKDVLIAMARTGETIYEYQLARLSAEDRQAVLDVLASLGQTLNTTWPGQN